MSPAASADPPDPHAFGFAIEETFFVNDAARRDLAKSIPSKSTPPRSNPSKAAAKSGSVTSGPSKSGSATSGLAPFAAAWRARHPAGEDAGMDRANGRGPVRTPVVPRCTIATPELADFASARALLAERRRELGALAAEHGLAPMAAGTHPVAILDAGRDESAGGPSRAGVAEAGVCALTIRVAVPAGVSCVDLMNRAKPYLPLLLALSTSSPFWQARRTGLLGFRLAVEGRAPHHGLPETFRDEADYARFVETLVAARAIDGPDALRWLVRPAALGANGRSGPALELRVADSCTRLDDALAIAALARCLVRRLARDPDLNADASGASRAMVAENCWRAGRQGIHGSFVDEAERAAKPVKAVLAATLELVAEDAAALGCEAELDLTRWIIARGTSADRQLALFTEAQGRGRPPAAALGEVVDWLAAETIGAAPTRH